MKLFKTWMLPVLMLLGCQSQSQEKGSLTINSYFYNKDSTSGVADSVKLTIWWKNDQTIQEVPLMVMNEDIHGNRENSVRIQHYSYLLGGQNTGYNYSSFSDTAKLLRFYSSIASVSKY